MAKVKEILRSKDVAQILDCSPDDVIQLGQKGLMGAYKDPGSRFWKFPMRAVMKFKKAQEEKQ